MITHLHPSTIAPSPFLSPGVLVTRPERTLYISGQVGVTADGHVGDGIAEQTKIATGNLRAVLAEAGMSVEQVIKYTIYLTDPANLEGFLAAGADAAPQPGPAGTLLIVDQLADPRLLVEIEAIAAD
ncbi:RidA family protein [Microlunatus parietis]|uniref:Enamine deaminase RidA (YjgF/YER057c/UK114 family) n=1 Tax=Microlunatus parietis TaxID=682979 RepID=A0A7Y9L7N2_9ACTN|nr:RidA family protein [Microlunatus parietis]NYE69944.1 enamine deaminase RidA (YjgF/YER057c/UK114 family) [Microlunatus parietis]